MPEVLFYEVRSDMLSYILRRFLYMILIMMAVSVVAFTIIQLPPGDFVTTYVQSIEMSGTRVDNSEIIALRKIYGLDRSMLAQYVIWMSKLLRGNLGISLQWNRPVAELLAERIPLTVAVSTFTLLFTYIIAIPIGIYSATHQYSFGDYAFTVVGFAGMAVPNFLFALILMFLFFKYLGMSVGGLFSAEFATQGWSLAKFANMLQHLPVPIIVIGLAGTAGLIRVMRGCLLDEIRKQYVITARSKGVNERVLLYRYPVRVAINPIVSTIGWTLPAIVSGEAIVSIVLSLPTTGPLLFQALRSEDMYVTGSILLVLSFLTVVGTFLSDMLLVWIDPRIRFEKKQQA